MEGSLIGARWTRRGRRRRRKEVEELKTAGSCATVLFEVSLPRHTQLQTRTHEKGRDRESISSGLER